MSLTLSCAILFLTFIYFYLTQKRPHNFPPGPQWYPIIGNSFQLRQAARKLGGIHRVFEKWSKEFNSPDVVGFRLGGQLFIVGLSEKAVREIHMRTVFEGRPKNFFIKLRNFNTFGGFMMADGDLWREHRSFAMKRLKSIGFGQDYMQERIEKEVEYFERIIDKKMNEEGYVWPGEIIGKHVMNILWTFTAGSECSDYEKLMALMDKRSKAFDFSGGLLSDMPWVRFIAPEYSGYNLLLEFNEKIQKFLSETIGEHERTFSDEKDNDDFIYAFMKEMKTAKEEGRSSTFTNTQLMIVMLDLFIGGAHTTNSTLDLALMGLVFHQDFQEELFEEVKKVFSAGNSKFIRISQHRDLPLMEAYLMETARFHSIVPISGPRRALEDTELCGFNIPKDTTVLIGTEAVHMNKDNWGDPEVFRPSRFLNESQTKICESDHLIQFGQGRRSCMGVSMAKAFLFTFLTSIVHDYKLSAKDENPPDLNFKTGIFKMIEPYKIKFTKRDK